jgi:hypothetical protein
MRQIASLTVTRGALVHFGSWPAPSTTGAPRGSGSGTGLALRAWRAFPFHRTAASRISRARRWRPHGSLTSSRGRAPQPSRSIRIHRNARCEPKRCDRGITVFVPTPRLRGGFKKLDPCRIPPDKIEEATSLSRGNRWSEEVASRKCRSSTPSSAAPSRSHVMGGAVARAKATATSVHSPAIRLTTLGGQYRRHPYRLETLSALVLNDHAYDKLTGWSNVIAVVPVKGDATETYKFIKEESHGTRSTPHRHRT